MIDRARLLGNLQRLRQDLQPAPPVSDARKLAALAAAQAMPLTHGVTTGTMEILSRPGNPGEERALLSQEALSQRLGKNICRKSETIMGTTNDVFLFFSAFAYPNTQCGFLFNAAFTAQAGLQATATPFDTGAFASKVTPPTGTTTAERRKFKFDHEMPLPECREYLADQLAACFTSVADYLHGHPPYVLPPGHPLPMAVPLGTDTRVYTHEAQVKEKIPLGGTVYLERIFVPEGFRLSLRQAIREAFGAEFKFEPYPVPPPSHPDAGTFKAMRRSCVDYILRQW